MLSLLPLIVMSLYVVFCSASLSCCNSKEVVHDYSDVCCNFVNVVRELRDISLLNVERYVGWGLYTQEFYAIILPCFPAFADLLSLCLVTFINVFLVLLMSLFLEEVRA